MYSKERLEKLVGTKLELIRNTNTTSRHQVYEILGYNHAGKAWAEVNIINDNGRRIHLLLNRFNNS